MDIFEDSNFKVNKFLLTAIGCWPYQDIWRKRVLQYLYYAMLNFTMVLLVITRPVDV